MAIVIIVATIMILLSQPTTIHLEDMVTIEFSGYNTVGQAYRLSKFRGIRSASRQGSGQGKFDSLLQMHMLFVETLFNFP